MAEKSDLKDFGVVGQKPVRIERLGDEQVYLKLVNKFKNDSLDTTGKTRSLYLYKGQRVVEIPDGRGGYKTQVIRWNSKKGAHFVPFEAYKTSLIRTSRIPKKFLKQILIKEGQLAIPGTGVKTVQRGASQGFADWFAKDIMKKQTTEKNFWNRLGKLFQEYEGELTKRNKSSVNLDDSHFWPVSKGGRFTFLEHWLVNQRRGAKTFIDLAVLKQADIPVTYQDLFNHYQDVVLGGKKVWYGSLNNLSIDDINALARGDSVPEVILRRKSINQIVTEYGKLLEADPASDRVLSLEDDYRRLVQKSRGFDYLTADNTGISLANDAKLYSSAANAGTGIGSGYQVENEPYIRPEGTKVKGYDINLDEPSSGNPLQFSDNMKIGSDGSIALQKPNLIDQLQIGGQNLLKKGGNYLKNEFGPGAASDVGFQLFSNREYEKRLVTEGDYTGVGVDLAKDAVIGETVWGVGKKLLNKYAPKVLPTVSKGIGAAMAVPLIGKAVVPTVAATALLGLTARPAGSYYENEMDDPNIKRAMRLLDNTFEEDE